MNRPNTAVRRPPSGVAALTVGAVIAALIAVASPATAVGPGESIYWASEVPGNVGVGALDGSGSAGALFNPGGQPCGVALDPAAGRIYWTNFGSSEVQVGNLDGSGIPTTLTSGENGACGIAVDPAAGRIYWATYGGGTIRGADLANVTGTAQTLFSVEPNPTGVAIDPATNKIYWANQSGTIRVGSLDGSGPASTLFGGETQPVGVAIDPANHKIYWADLANGTIRVGPLDGSGPASTLFSGESGPAGLAIDPGANQIYWANFLGVGEIRHGNLDGTGSAQTLGSLTGLGNFGPNFPVLLRVPVGTALPAITTGGGALTCSQGGWAPDLLGGFLFRAPHDFAYQWLLDGAAIPTATASTFTPTAPGDYTCRVTASNHAGSASQTSAPWVIYHWSGFFSPVDNPTVLNTAKAGQAIPVKWALTDASGAPITDASSFLKLASVSESCSTLDNTGADAIETYTGGSGLQNMGGGYWQFNWATPRSYAGTCREMDLRLADGSVHVADFKFTK